MRKKTEFFSKEELLTGLPARRANTLLFAIESRAAFLAAQSEQACECFVPQATIERRNQDFLDAIALSREPQVKPTIHDLERFAPQWKSLVVENPAIRASLAHLLSQKYTFSAQSVPAIRAALRLDEMDVRSSYQSLYHKPLDSIYSAGVQPLERLRFAWAVLGKGVDGLSPFWTAFVFIVVISLPQTFLALPIAMGNVGPIPGIALIALLGGINVLTVICMAEALTRSGAVRYGSTFIGRIASDYLGRTGSSVLTLSIAVLFFLALLASLMGLAKTISGFTGIPEALVAALLFPVEIYLLARLTIGLTVSFLLGAINIGLILLISLLALPRLQPQNLLYINLPIVAGRGFEAGILQPVLGVALMAFFGHVLMGQSARLILKRDPGGKSLVRGSIAGMAFLTFLLCLWIIAVNGAVPAGTLVVEKGTAIVPLAAATGPAISLLGSVLVVLLLGLTSIRCSTVLFNMAKELLPAQSRWVSRIPKTLAPGGPARFFLANSPAISPVILAFLVVEWLLISEAGSFSLLISLAGVTTISIITGIFPVLLLAASRRKGERIPGTVIPWIGHPVLIFSIYFFFLGIIFLHGLVIWQNPVQKTGALLIGFAVLAATFRMIRQRAFTRRVVVELREEGPDALQRLFTISAAGQPTTTQLSLGYPDGEQQLLAAVLEVPKLASLRYARFQPPPAGELKVWAHRITEGISESLPARLAMICGPVKREFDLQQSGGQVVAPIADDGCMVELALIEKV